ncbi:two-partner secretion domain-containing protein [Candidatus Nitrospira salsa]
MLSLALLSLVVSGAEGQVTTAITTDDTLGTLVTRNGDTYNITGGIRPDDGLNLFHSLGQLSVGVGDIGNFLNDSGLPTANILSRVTGGDPSKIFGTIQTTDFGEANLFLINPAGVMFGPTAFMNVTGSFHVSTADFVRLGTDGFFFADLGNQSVLTTASPDAFGFLGGNPGNISVDQSTLEVSSEKNISLVGGNIEITGGTVIAPTGQISLASLISQGEITLNDGPTVQVNAEQLGEIKLSADTWVNTDGEGGGTIVIRSGSLMMDAAKISSDTVEVGSVSSSPSAGEINIRTDQNVLLDNLSVIQSDVLDGSNDGANIILDVGGVLEVRGGFFDPTLDLDLLIFSGIRTFAFGGTGNAGDIDVHADAILFNSDNSGILGLALPDTAVELGDIRVTSNSLLIDGDGSITSSTVGSGNSGNVDIIVHGGDIFLSTGGITAATFGSGDGGNINVEARNLRLTNTAIIQTGTDGPGNAGSANIQLTGNLKILSGSFIGSLVGVDCVGSGCGAAGDTTIRGKDIVITGIENAANPLVTPFFTGIRTRSVAELGGNVIVNADNLQISDNGVIRSSSLGPERAGDITINLDGNLELVNKGQILATADGTGDGGNINVSATNLTLTNEASVTAESFSLTNDAGDAGTITLRGQDTILIENSTVTTRAQNAVAGDINIEAENLIQVMNSDIISEVPEGSGSAGRINFDPQFIVVQGSRIDTSANLGDGGDVTFVADAAILIDPFSTIDTSSRFGGSGTIDIRAPIQNLGETIAPLPEEILRVSGLFAARCAAQKGGMFSSFLQGGRDGTPPGATNFLPSPLTFSTAGPEGTTSVVSRLGFDDRKVETEWRFFDTTHTADLAQGCSAVPASRS